MQKVALEYISSVSEMGTFGTQIKHKRENEIGKCNQTWKYRVNVMLYVR